MSEFLTQNALKGTHHPNSSISAQDLLFELGIRGLQRMAGRVPAITRSPLLETAPSDEKILCSEQTIHQFRWLMRKNYRGLIFMWLQKFSATGQRLPDELIPMVMDNQSSAFGVFRTSQFQKIVGNRAKWLADLSQNQSWISFNVESSPVNPLRPNNRSRLNQPLHYRNLRGENREEAQNWLYKNWDRLGADDHVSVLDIMCDALAIDDLPFLLEQLDLLDDFRDSAIMDKVYYMVSILHPEHFEGFIQEILHLIRFEFMEKQKLPILDFCWSNSFCHSPHYKGRGILRKIAAKHRWWETVSQLMRLIPLDYWLDLCNARVETLLNGARQGLHEDIFIPIWTQRAIDEKHEAFALGVLKHQRPISYFFGWRVSKQSKLLDCLSFESIQILLDEAWMRPAKETSWQIR